MAPATVPIIRCEKCRGLFSCIQKLKSHFCVRRYSCIVCNVTFSSRILLQDHIQCSNHQARTFSPLTIFLHVFWNLKNRGLIDSKFPVNANTYRKDSTFSNGFKASFGSHPVQESHVTSQANEEAAREKEAPEVSCSYENTSLRHDSGESTPNSETTVCKLDAVNGKCNDLCDMNKKNEISNLRNTLCDVNGKVETTGESTVNDKSINLKSVNTISESSVINADTTICQGDVKNKSVPNCQDTQNSKDASINKDDHIGTFPDNEDQTDFRKINDQTERLMIPGMSDESPFVSEEQATNVAITNTNGSASLTSLPGPSSSASKCDGFSPEVVLSKQLKDAVGTHEQIEEKKTSDQTQTEADSIDERDGTNCLLVTNSTKRNTVLSSKTKTLVAAWLRQSVSGRGNETKSDTSKTSVDMNRTTSLKPFSSDEVHEIKSCQVNHSKSKKLEKLRSDIEREKAFANIQRGLMPESDACTENRIISFKVKTVPRRRANSLDNESGAESSSPSYVEDLFELMSTAPKNPTLVKTSNNTKATKEKENAKKLRIEDSTDLSLKFEDSIKMNDKMYSATGRESTRDLKGQQATDQRKASRNATMIKTNNSSKTEEKENDKKITVADTCMEVKDCVKTNDKTSPAVEKCQNSTGNQNKLRLSENRHSSIAVKENASVDDNSDVIFLYSSDKKERNGKAKKIKTSTLTTPPKNRKPGKDTTKASTTYKETRSGKDDNRTQTDARFKRSNSLMERIQANESLKRAYETPCPVIERKKQLQSRCVSDSSSDTESESNDANSNSQLSSPRKKMKSGSHHLSFNYSDSPGDSSDDQNTFHKRRKRDRSRSREYCRNDQPKKIKSPRNSCTSAVEKCRLSRSTSSESEASQSSAKSGRLDAKLYNRRPNPKEISDPRRVTIENKSIYGKGKSTFIKRDIISQTNKNLIRKILLSSSNVNHHRGRPEQCIGNSSKLVQKKEELSISQSPRNYLDDISTEEDGEVQEHHQEEKKCDTDSLEVQIQNQDENVNSDERVGIDHSCEKHRTKGNVNHTSIVDGEMDIGEEKGCENNTSLSQAPPVCNIQESNSEIQEKSVDGILIIESDVILTKRVNEKINSNQRNIQPEHAGISSLATDIGKKSVIIDVRKSAVTNNLEPVSLDGFYRKCIVESKEFRGDSQTNVLEEDMSHCEVKEDKTNHYGPNTDSVKIREIKCETSTSERDENFNKVSNGDKSMDDEIAESIESDGKAVLTKGDGGCDTIQQQEVQMDSTQTNANNHQLSDIRKGKEFESHLQEFRAVDPNTEVMKPKVPLCQSDSPEVSGTKGHHEECMDFELTALQQSDNFLTISCRDNDDQLTLQPETDYQPSTSSRNNYSHLTLLQKADQVCDSTGLGDDDRKVMYTSECKLNTENRKTTLENAILLENFSYCQNEYSDPLFEEDNLSDAGTAKSILLYDTDDEQLKGVTHENKLSLKCDRTTSCLSFSTPNDFTSVNQGSEIGSTTALQTDMSPLPKRPAVQDKPTSHLLGREESQSNLPTSDNRVSNGPQRRKTQLHRSTKDKMHSEKSKRRSKARSPDRKLKETKRESGRDPHLKIKKPMKRVEKNYVKYMTSHCPECNTAFVLDEFMSVNLSTGDVSVKCSNCLMYTCMMGVVLKELKKICGRHKYSPKDPKGKVKLSGKPKGGEGKENLKSKHKSRSNKSQGREKQKEENKTRKTEDERSKRRKERNRIKNTAEPPEGIAKADANTEKKILFAGVKRKKDHKEDDGRKKVRTKDKEKGKDITQRKADKDI